MKLSPNEMAHCLLAAGFTLEEAKVMVAIGLAESTLPGLGFHGADTETLARSDTGASIGNRDHGWLQISNRWHADKLAQPDLNWRDPYDNAKIAKLIYDERKASDPNGIGYTAWAVFNSAAYSKYIPDAEIALKLPFPVRLPADLNLLLKALGRQP